MTFKDTPEQEAIFAAVQDSNTSLMISAYAGCGKTTTITKAASFLPTNKPALALAFNVKIKQELERRFPPHFQIKTMNGLGHGAWAKSIGKFPAVDDKKLGRLVSAAFKAIDYFDDEAWDACRKLVSAAMQAGLVPSVFPFKGLVPDSPQVWSTLSEEIAPDEELISIARDVLISSIKEGTAGTICFDDQIYLSTMFGGVFPRFPLVMVDEAQDLSPLNHLMVKKVSGDRIIVVGDPKQAIYGFRGADSASMANMRKLRPEWLDLNLTLTFRCPRDIVARQQEHAPGFTAAEGNLQGQVIRKPSEDPLWTWEEIDALPGETAVLCRNNAPLLSLAFKLLKKRISIVFLGRDLGKGLISLSKKILKSKSIPREDCFKLINEWRETQRSLAEANDQIDKLSGIEDKADCLLAVLQAEDIENAGQLRDAIQALFSRETGKVTLSSIHRSKGLEWDNVVHLDPWRIPSKYAKRAAALGHRAQLEQELNLRYVAETRSKNNLVLVALDHFQEEPSDMD